MRLRRREKRVVRLHLKNDPRSIEGILYHEDQRHYYLFNAKVIVSTHREKDTELDGKTWWPRTDVFHVQEIEP